MSISHRELIETSAPIAQGPFQPSWDSLAQYQCPEWFRDAKFGIWAHWDPQCAPEQGEWYARQMYFQGSGDYNHHVKTYGHPSQVGFKEIERMWKAENWEPEKLMALYTVSLLGHGDVPFTRTAEGLVVTLPVQKPCDHAYALKITGLDLASVTPCR